MMQVFLNIKTKKKRNEVLKIRLDSIGRATCVYVCRCREEATHVITVKKRFHEAAANEIVVWPSFEALSFMESKPLALQALATIAVSLLILIKTQKKHADRR